LWTSSQRGYRRRCMMTSRPVYVLALSTVETEGGWGCCVEEACNGRRLNGPHGQRPAPLTARMANVQCAHTRTTRTPRRARCAHALALRVCQRAHALALRVCQILAYASCVREE
jgi:hypothetical protein